MMNGNRAGQPAAQRSFALALLTATLWCQAAVARDIYVDNARGDDRYFGRTPLPGAAADGPCRSLTRALFLARAGDRVILAKNPEPYRESVTLQGARHSGTANTPFRIQGNGAVLDGRVSIRSSVWESWRGDIYRFQPAFMSLGMLFQDDIPAGPPQQQLVNAQPAKLAPGQGILHGSWYYFRAEAGKIPHEYELSAASLSVGVTLCDVRQVVLEDLHVIGYRVDGVSAADGATQVQMVKVTAQANGRSGFAIKGASRVELLNCESSGNGHAQVWLDDYATLRVAQSKFSEDTAPPVRQLGGRLQPFLAAP